MKARIIIEGNVQGVGYRALVKQIGKRLGIKGMVRNLDDGTVEAFCDCTSEILQKFVSMIDVKGDSKETFSVHVEKINVYKKGEKGYLSPSEDIKVFDVDYGMELTSFEKESLERSEIGALLLLATKDEVRATKDEVRSSRGDMRAMHQDLKGELKGFREETKNEFNTIKTDYGRISQDLTKAIQGIESVAKNTGRLLERSEKDRNDFRDAIKELARAIVESKK